MFGVLSFCAVVSLQAPDTLQVNEQTAPTGVLKADFRATPRLVGFGPATGFGINVSTNPAVGGSGEFVTSTHWWSLSPAALVNPARIDPDINSFLDLFSSLSYAYEPTTAALNSPSPEIPYGWGGGAVVNPLSWNTSYYWQIRSRHGGGPFTTSAWSAPAPFTMGQPSASASANGNGSPTASSWRFVALPIMSGTTVPASELLDDVSLLYKLDEPTRTFIQITSPAELLQGGRGYLAWCGPGTTLDLSQGTVAHGDQTLTFSYTTTGVNDYRGNHLFGNPFNTSIDWGWIVDFGWYFSPPAGYQARQGDVHAWGAGMPLDLALSASMYRWDGTQYLTYNGFTHAGGAGSTIAPFQAVGVVATESAAQLQLRQPAPKAGAGVPKRRAKLADPGTDPNRWMLTLAVESAGALDTENIVGLDFEARDDWDPRDSEEPGTLNGTWVLLSMDHADWPVNPRAYTHDFRRTPADAGGEVVWTLTLDGNTGAPATISWPAVSTSDWTLVLEDPAAGATADLGASTSYVTGPLNGKRTLLLRATRQGSFQGSLLLSAPGALPAAEIEAGRSGVAMLDVLVQAVDEPVTLRSFSVTPAGTGDPAHAMVSLRRGGVLLAGPTAFTGGVVSWSGLAERVEPGQPQAWQVVYDFDLQARGTYAAAVSASQAEGLGVYSAKSLVPAPASLQGPAMKLVAAEGSGAGDGACGLLGLEVLLLVLARRRRRNA